MSRYIVMCVALFVCICVVLAVVIDAICNFQAVSAAALLHCIDPCLIYLT